ncbi:MAG TPA: peptidylprolyl isomerase [Caulobacteraceae bacterium]|nr:peptidylprolyl isomerase [Caulobacteraceae bacterium]
MTLEIERRTVLTGSLALAATQARAQSDPGLVRVALKTVKGVITLDLNAAKAPITTRNFLRYVDAKRFDHAGFYRVSHAPNDPSYGLVQGGLRGDPAKLFKPIPHESTAITGLSHKDGTISMARGKPGTAAAEFFICVRGHEGLDAGGPGGDADGFAAFGQVVEGMDVVAAIFAIPPSPTAGVGALRGQMLVPPVTILTARRVV